MGDIAKIDQQTAEFRGSIHQLEQIVGAMPQVDMPVTHWHAHGLYGRQLFIPKGTVLTGKIHKYSHINVVLQGDISVSTEDGVKRIRAPYIFVAKAGVKRAGFAHEDTVWITFHASNETDLEALEKDLIAKSFEEFDALANEPVEKLGG